VWQAGRDCKWVRGSCGCVGGNTAAFTPTPACSYPTVSNTHLIAEGNSEQLACLWEIAKEHASSLSRDIMRMGSGRVWRRVVWSKGVDVSKRPNASIFTLAWWWRQNVPLKAWYISTRIHGVTTRNTKIIVTALRTSDVERRHLGVPFFGDMVERVKGVFLTFISGYFL